MQVPPVCNYIIARKSSSACNPVTDQAVAVATSSPRRVRRKNSAAYHKTALVKKHRSKFAPVWCKRGDSNSNGGCHTHLKRACLPIPTLLRLPYSLVIIANAAVLVNTFFDRTAGSYEQLCGVPTGLSLALRISCAGLRSRSLLGKIANMSLTANSISSIIKPIENARHRRA